MTERNETNWQVLSNALIPNVSGDYAMQEESQTDLKNGFAVQNRSDFSWSSLLYSNVSYRIKNKLVPADKE